jgi:hypothetical protein
VNREVLAFLGEAISVSRGDEKKKYLKMGPMMFALRTRSKQSASTGFNVKSGNEPSAVCFSRLPVFCAGLRVRAANERLL